MTGPILKIKVWEGGQKLKLEKKKRRRPNFVDHFRPARRGFSEEKVTAGF